MENVDIVLMLSLGLVSSLHCATMCGPLIGVATAPVAERRRGRMGWIIEAGWWQIAYHGGRGITYVLLGGILAALGTSLEKLAPARPVGGAIQLTVGAALIIFAVIAMLRGKAMSAPEGGGLLVRGLRRLLTSGRVSGMFGLGLVTAFLPCGVLYAAYARAIAAPSPTSGAIFMLAFWLGTVPLLFALGMVSAGAMSWLGRHAKVLVFLAVTFTGGWLSWKGVHNLSADEASAPPACHRHSASLYLDYFDRNCPAPTPDHST